MAGGFAVRARCCNALRLRTGGVELAAAMQCAQQGRRRAATCVWSARAAQCRRAEGRCRGWSRAWAWAWAWAWVAEGTAVGAVAVVASLPGTIAMVTGPGPGVNSARQAKTAADHAHA